MRVSIAGNSGKSSLNNSLRDIKWVQKKSDTVVADVWEVKIVEEAKVVVDEVLNSKVVDGAVSGKLDYFCPFLLRTIQFPLM